MLTLLGCIGMFILVVLLAVLLLLGMFFSSDAGYAFADIFNFATTRLPGIIVLTVLALVVLGISALLQMGLLAWISDRLSKSNIPTLAQILILLVVLVPIPWFLFASLGLIYRLFGVMCILLYVVPALLTIWAYICDEFEGNPSKKTQQ